MVYKLKMLSHFCRFACRCPRWQSVVSAFICVTAILAVGCQKKEQNAEVPSVAETNASQSTPVSPAPVANPGTSVTTATNALPDLRPLNQALLSWRLQNRRVPANFEEFAASTDVQIPPLPPEKKYIINNRGLISVVNR